MPLHCPAPPVPQIDWQYIIIDEAQRMKDRQSKLARDLDKFNGGWLAGGDWVGGWVAGHEQLFCDAMQRRLSVTSQQRPPSQHS